MHDHKTVEHLRAFLAWAWLGLASGTVAELLLLGHTEDTWQILPLALLFAGVANLAWAHFSGRKLAFRLFRVVSVASLATALAGLWLHYGANVEFELEMYPDLAGWALFWKSIQGKSPPTLAPGMMAVTALIGWAWTHRHPAFGATDIDKGT